MKTLLLFSFLILSQINPNILFSQQSPCPCDCDEIISSNNFGNNRLVFVRSLSDPNCYDMNITLNACGGRTITGFFFSVESPNCFEGKEISFLVDGVPYGYIDLANTQIPPFFQFENSIDPCTKRDVNIRICFKPGEGADCLSSASSETESFTGNIDFQFGPNDPPCPTQEVKTYFDIIPLVGVEDVEISDYFIIENNSLKLDVKYQSDYIHLYDLNGKIIKTSFDNSLNVSDINTGVYIIIIKDGNNYNKTTFIKQN